MERESERETREFLTFDEMSKFRARRARRSGATRKSFPPGLSSLFFLSHLLLFSLETTLAPFRARPSKDHSVTSVSSPHSRVPLLLPSPYRHLSLSPYSASWPRTRAQRRVSCSPSFPCSSRSRGEGSEGRARSIQLTLAFRRVFPFHPAVASSSTNGSAKTKSKK